MDKKGKQNKKSRLALPDAYVILFIILLLAAIATYFIPAGTYERVTEGDVTKVVPDSFEYAEESRTTVIDLFVSIQNGMIDSADLIFLVLIIGGAFAVVESTGAIDSLIMRTIDKTKNKEALLIIFVAGLFSILGTLGVIVNAVIAFIPIGIILARTMKLDAIVGVSIIYLGAYAGFTTAFLDPLTTGMAQQIAEVPLFSGIGYRVIVYLAVLLVTILYIIWYTRKIKNNPEKSIIAENPFPKFDEESIDNAPTELTLIHKLTLSWLTLGIAFYVFGVFRFDWALNEMAGMFILIAVGTAIIAKITPNKLVTEFFQGCKSLVYGALIIGMARSIVVVLEDGNVLDTIVHGMSIAMSPFTSATGAVVMFIANSLFNLIVSSGSGQAMIVMPIMTPLADMMEIPRQVAVQAYKLGDGFTNTVTPTSGVLMASLAVAGVPWTKWIKFMFPLLLIWTAIGIISIIISIFINWGPI